MNKESKTKKTKKKTLQNTYPLIHIH
jgi:hypothetical protein